MEKNEIPINQILDDLAVDAKSIQKQQIIEFSVKFASKFIKKCIEMKQDLSTTKKIKVEDVRQSYEAIKTIRSFELNEKVEQKKKAVIERVNKQMFDKSQFRKCLENMLLNNEQQITFQ